MAVLSCSHLEAQDHYFSRKDTLVFAPDSSYARAMERNGRQLIFGTSKNGVVALNEKTGAVEELIPPSASGEFRSVIPGKTTFGMVSGDHGEIWSSNTAAPFLAIHQPGLFFDDMDRHRNSITILGDPDAGKFSLFILETGTLKLKVVNGPKAIGDEACYAASGTTVLHPADSTIIFISGGSKAARYHRTDNLGRTWLSAELPMSTGEGCGPFSICAIDGSRVLIVGGCYADPAAKEKTALYSTDGGKSWKNAETPPGGYRSCVTGNKKVQFACGTNGIDISIDGGKNWTPFDRGNYCALLLEKKHVYATTGKGYCVRYRLK